MSIDLNTMPKLGFGMMRLPEKDGKIDIGHVCRMVDQYMQAGMNYFDTAYVYHGGHSEEAVREAIAKRYPRESFMVATKLPAWCMKAPEDRDRIFNEQLGYTSIITDPSWANYNTFIDTSIVNDYPALKAYKTIGSYNDLWFKSHPESDFSGNTEKILKRNMLYFALFRRFN